MTERLRGCARRTSAQTTPTAGRRALPETVPDRRRVYARTLQTMSASIPAWLTLLAWVWIGLSFASAAVLVLLLVKRPQPMAVMNVVWPITALYLGPIAVWWYWTLARMGNASTVPRPFWQTIIVETTHCGAGCTLGDIVAENIIAAGAFTIAGSTLHAEFAGDYILALTFGVAFQYFAIAPMRGLSLRAGIIAAIQADVISLTAFEIGLFAAMYGMTLLPFHLELGVRQPVFWFLMQIGMAIGYITSYPANWLLVRVGIKEAM
jgi:Domain of unknown function (DUF4396)